MRPRNSEPGPVPVETGGYKDPKCRRDRGGPHSWDLSLADRTRPARPEGQDRVDGDSLTGAGFGWKLNGICRKFIQSAYPPLHGNGCLLRTPGERRFFSCLIHNFWLYLLLSLVWCSLLALQRKVAHFGLANLVIRTKKGAWSLQIWWLCAVVLVTFFELFSRSVRYYERVRCDAKNDYQSFYHLFTYMECLLGWPN